MKKKRERVASLSNFYVYTCCYVYKQTFFFQKFPPQPPFEKCLDPRLCLDRVLEEIRRHIWGCEYLGIDKKNSHPYLHWYVLLEGFCMKRTKVFFRKLSLGENIKMYVIL